MEGCLKDVYTSADLCRSDVEKCSSCRGNHDAFDNRTRYATNEDSEGDTQGTNNAVEW